MDQVQNMELSKDQIIQELIALLNQNQQKEAVNDVFEMTVLIVRGVRRNIWFKYSKVEEEPNNDTYKQFINY